jgi:hypothetical protein
MRAPRAAVQAQRALQIIRRLAALPHGRMDSDADDGGSDMEEPRNDGSIDDAENENENENENDDDGNRDMRAVPSAVADADDYSEDATLVRPAQRPVPTYTYEAPRKPASAPASAAPRPASSLAPLYTWPIGQSTYGGSAACTTIAVIAGLHALYTAPESINMRLVISRGADSWKRNSGVFQNVREVFRQTPRIETLVCMAEDGEVFGSVNPRTLRRVAQILDNDGLPGTERLLLTVEQAVDVLDAARDAFSALGPCAGSPRISNTLVGSGCGVVTANGGSYLAIATRDGAYYVLDSHGHATLWKYTREELEDDIRTAARGGAGEFTLTILATPETRDILVGRL